mmetsp:Transcript_98903/g.279416  ORF Transcript_98903/g.279416 Transcript_98903/m.279416 type:complete len:240 (-) Transcript_98903:367-1086(-)
MAAEACTPKLFQAKLRAVTVEFPFNAPIIAAAPLLPRSLWRKLMRESVLKAIWPLVLVLLESHETMRVHEWSANAMAFPATMSRWLSCKFKFFMPGCMPAAFSRLADPSGPTWFLPMSSSSNTVFENKPTLSARAPSEPMLLLCTRRVLSAMDSASKMPKWVPPSSPSSLLEKSKKVMPTTVLTRVSTSAFAPSSPILFAQRAKCRKPEPSFIALPSAVTPSLPMFCEKMESSSRDVFL